MDSYPAHKLFTGREIARHRLRGLQASKERQRLNRRTSEGLMSTESLSSILQKFDLNGDGDDRKMAKEFVSALRSLNAAPAAGQRSMSALSDHDIRSIIQTISSPETRPGHTPDANSPDANSPDAKSKDYHRLSRCRSYGDASDGFQVPKSNPNPNPNPDPDPDADPDPNPDPNQVPKCLTGRKWHDHGAILAGEDNTEPSGTWPGAHAED